MKRFSTGNLTAFKHYGFWQCMDTLRDKEILEKKLKKLNKSILIAGGTGFIGFHLAKKCLSLNWSVTSLSTSVPKKRKTEKVRYKLCDVSNYKQIIKR